MDAPPPEPVPVPKPRPPVRIAPRKPVTRAVGRVAPRDMSDPAVAAIFEASVMTEIDKIQNKKKSWIEFIIVLLISVGLYSFSEMNQAPGGMSSGGRAWKSLYLIIPILLLHESGHYAAMKLFGYKNMQMFFIPFFGAAVSGHRYGLPGWKQVVVSLMGPLPGIAIGFVLGIVALQLKHPMLREAAKLLLLLNTLNLLPILPADGGRVVQALFFCRHPILDIGFRVMTSLITIGMGVFLDTIPLMVIGGMSVLMLPMAWRLGKLAAALKDDADHEQIAASDALHKPLLELIVKTLIQDKKIAAAGAPQVATQALSVYEQVSSLPPDWGATIGLSALYAGAFVAGSIMAVALIVSQVSKGRFGF